ncbi:MAG: transposase [Verrucomicrobiota bacterium]
MERLPEEGPSFPSRKTKRLRKGRLSTAGSRYFLTLVAHHRKSGLDHPQILSRIREVLFLMQKEGDFDLLCGTVMPDHLHLLVLLQDRLSLSQCVQKLKTKTRRVLLAANLRWQANYFDHRLRAEQTNEPFAFYIFLNPYRKKLIDPESVWAGWIGSESYRPHFQQSLIDGLFPPSSWVESESNFQDLIEVQGRKK